MSPQVKKELTTQLERAKLKMKSLKNELLVRTKTMTAETKEDKEEAAATKEMEEELRGMKVRLKKFHVESRRKDVAVKELRSAFADEQKEKKRMETELSEVRKKFEDSKKSHSQRKAAIDALREGVTAQRSRVEMLQGKVNEHSRLEEKMRSIERERERVSSELQESHVRYRKIDDRRTSSERDTKKWEERCKTTEERARHAVEDSERRVALVEHRAKAAKTKIHEAIIHLAETIIDDIGRCRVRLRSARRSVTVPS
jgi:predicted  nucleic acid-binding Zn-ribbon protein